MPLSVDASNSCIPPSYSKNLVAHVPPLPTTVRGVPLSLHGDGGRFNNNDPSTGPLLVYPSGRFVVVRELSSSSNDSSETKKRIQAFVYRGHTANVTTAKFSPSGCYIASGDTKGKLRVWSYDNDEHLCKLDIQALSGPIRDISWDMDSKRLVIVGEGSKADPSSLCTRVIQWDTGVSCGQLAQHTFKKSSSCAFKRSRPMRIVTAGGEDSKCYMNAGPPFKRVTVGEASESCHVRGAVHCVRYNTQGTVVASIGTDKSVCFYNGTSMDVVKKMEKVHGSSIYSCAWNNDGDELLTCSADGTAKCISVKENFEVVQTWDVTNTRIAKDGTTTKVPLGAMQMGCAFVKGNGRVSISLNGKITILGNNKSSSSSLTGHQSPISCMDINYSNGTMYTGDSDGVICTWNIQTGEAISNVQRGKGTDTEDGEGFDTTLMNKVHRGAITGMVSNGNGTLLSIGWDDTIRFTESESSIATSSLKLPSQPNKIVKGTELVVVMTVDGLILVRSNSSAVTEDNFIKLPYEPTTVCVSSDDRIIYVGGKDCSIHIYKINNDNTLDETHTISGIHLKPIYALSISNDGTKLASADVRDICVWNIEEDYNKVIGKGRWCFHNQKINVISWSNDDMFLASGANDDSIFIWSLKKPMKRLHYGFAHRDGITGLEFLKNEDGVVLASVGNDGCVNQWDITDDVMKKFG